MTDRELDALVAEKVMGEKIFDEHRHMKIYDDGPPMVVERGTNGQFGCSYGSVPHYSTSIEAAWLVEERMKALGREEDYAWELSEIVRPERAPAYVGAFQFWWRLAHAAPKDRCLAAIAALGEKGEKRG